MSKIYYEVRNSVTDTELPEIYPYMRYSQGMEDISTRIIRPRKFSPNIHLYAMRKNYTTDISSLKLFAYWLLVC